MKDSDFESQINNLVQNNIPTKDKYSRSKEKTSRGHNYSNPFKEEKEMNNYFHQETTESYVFFFKTIKCLILKILISLTKV